MNEKYMEAIRFLGLKVQYEMLNELNEKLKRGENVTFEEKAKTFRAYECICSGLMRNQKSKDELIELVELDKPNNLKPYIHGETIFIEFLKYYGLTESQISSLKLNIA